MYLRFPLFGRAATRRKWERNPYPTTLAQTFPGIKGGGIYFEIGGTKYAARRGVSNRPAEKEQDLVLSNQ
jgi:hypothetical protein